MLRINLWPGHCPRWPATTSQSYPCPPLMATPTWATRTGSTTPGRPPTLTTSARPRTSKGSRRGWCPPTLFQPKKRKKKAKFHSSKLSSPQSCDLIWRIFLKISNLKSLNTNFIFIWAAVCLQMFHEKKQNNAEVWIVMVFFNKLKVLIDR